MMRLALILLAIYTVMLSFIPCQDEVAVDSYDASGLISASEQPHPADLDLCSPFCVCSCCAGITLQQDIPSAPLATTFIVFKEITFAYSSGSNTGDLTSIWQPPRI